MEGLTYGYLTAVFGALGLGVACGSIGRKGASGWWWFVGAAGWMAVIGGGLVLGDAVRQWCMR